MPPKKFSQEEINAMKFEWEAERKRELEEKVKKCLEEELKKQWDQEVATSINQQLQEKNASFNKLLEGQCKNMEANFLKKLTTPPPLSTTTDATTT